MLSEASAIPQKRFEKRIEGTPPPSAAEAIFPPQLGRGQPLKLVQVVLSPLQRLGGFALLPGPSGLGSSHLLSNLADTLPAEARFFGQLAILLRPIHLGPLGQRRLCAGVADVTNEP